MSNADAGLVPYAIAPPGPTERPQRIPRKPREPQRVAIRKIPDSTACCIICERLAPYRIFYDGVPRQNKGA